MTDLTTVLFFQDTQCYDWKVDEMARRDGSDDVDRLLPYVESTRRHPHWRQLGGVLRDIAEARKARALRAA